MVRMILDIDSVADDILAILYSCAEPEINLEAVTTVMGASGSIEQATKVALNTLELAGRADVPVYAGADRPMIGHSAAVMAAPVEFGHQLAAKFGERLQGFNRPAPTPNRPAEDEHAVDYIVRTVMSNPGEITLVATGPMTNVALALLREPRIAHNVNHCFILGGCFKVPGNMTPVTEYNIWADPEAAKILLTSEMPVTIVPLDVCETNLVADSMLTHDDLQAFRKDNGNPVAQFLADFLPIYVDIWTEFFGLAGFPLDDVIAAALTVHPGICTLSEKVAVDVELSGEISRGQTIAYFGHQILPHEGKATARICSDINGPDFLNLFRRTIARYGSE